MKKNEIYTLQITGTTSDGKGVARHKDFVIFVPYAIAGEIVEAKILKVKKNIAFGKLLKIIKASPHRIEPQCDTFFQCGGCAYLHMDYSRQLQVKRQKVADCLQRIGKIEFPVEETLPSPKIFHYRNKGLMPIGIDEKGEVITGFYTSRTHRINPIEECLIQAEQAKQVVNCVKKWMKDYGIQPYDESSHTGILRHIYFRTGQATGQIMAGVTANAEKLPFGKELGERLLRVQGVVSAIHNINCEKTNVIMGDKTEILAGSSYITDEILNMKYQIGPLSFYQVNPYQTSNLYQIALDGLDLDEKDILFDIYCGIGTIGLCAAKRIKRLIGIEIVPEAIRFAEQNAILNEVGNAQFYTGKAEEIIYQLMESGLKPTAAVLDPPRAGCDNKLLDAIISLSPKKLCYISCDPATLARDLNYLLARSDYQIRKVKPVDMFPQTSHVEVITQLIKSDI